MIHLKVLVSTDTAAKLRHEAERTGKSVSDVASFYLAEGVSTCAFLFHEGVITPDSIAAEPEGEPYEG